MSDTEETLKTLQENNELSQINVALIEAYKRECCNNVYQLYNIGIGTEFITYDEIQKRYFTQLNVTTRIYFDLGSVIIAKLCGNCKERYTDQLCNQPLNMLIKFMNADESLTCHKCKVL